jgi:hypothetical protein
MGALDRPSAWDSRRDALCPVDKRGLLRYDTGQQSDKWGISGSWGTNEGADSQRVLQGTRG